MTNQDYRDGVLKLMQEKNKIEDEINNLTTILTKNGVGMLDPLVDTEGFPLSHIDIYQNDHQNIMKQIENGLHEYYSSSKDINVDHNIRGNISSTSSTTQQYKDPFAKVTIVTEGSPAAYAVSVIRCAQK
ncbi:26s proteasome non-atpase regulatory subunit 9 [Holotrichia oblita]|uniref:26s proteasome non-atpase regulatory subunit 9 n=1 Tax=Holotrichia oblita TaxID=644536 RepID=A0ACB9TNB9_HOLOL|nr:26s proteasome non-atpase regulatory subunit 9 [Holotrichia oblita]